MQAWQVSSHRRRYEREAFRLLHQQQLWRWRDGHVPGSRPVTVLLHHWAVTEGRPAECLQGSDTLERQAT